MHLPNDNAGRLLATIAALVGLVPGQGVAVEAVIKEYGVAGTQELLRQLVEDGLIVDSEISPPAVSLTGRGADRAEAFGVEQFIRIKAMDAERAACEEQRDDKAMNMEDHNAQRDQDTLHKRLVIGAARQVGAFQLSWCWQAIEYEKCWRGISDADWDQMLFNRSQHDTKVKQRVADFDHIVMGQTVRNVQETMGNIEAAEKELMRHPRLCLASQVQVPKHRISPHFYHRGDIPGIVRLSRESGDSIVGPNFIMQASAKDAGYTLPRLSLYETACFLRIVAQGGEPHRDPLLVNDINKAATKKLLDNGVRPQATDALDCKQLAALHERWSDMWSAAFVFIEPYLQ